MSKPKELQIAPALAATGGGRTVLVLHNDGTWEGNPDEAAMLIRKDEREKIATWLENWFINQRFGPAHAGLGDVRVTMGTAEDLIELIRNGNRNEAKP